MSREGGIIIWQESTGKDFYTEALFMLHFASNLISNKGIRDAGSTADFRILFEI